MTFGDLGDVAGLIAAIAFVLLVGFLAVPLWKLGKLLDEARSSVRDVTEHSVPILDEAAATVASANTQLVKVDTITTSAASVSENVSALTGLYAATLGKPARQGRRVLVRRAPGLRPGQGPVRQAHRSGRGRRRGRSMIRRLFWVGVGVAATVVVIRKGRQVVARYTPEAVSERAAAALDEAGSG